MDIDSHTASSITNMYNLARARVRSSPFSWVLTARPGLQLIYLRTIVYLIEECCKYGNLKHEDKPVAAYIISSSEQSRAYECDAF